MKRLADVTIDADGDDLVFRVRLPDRLRSLVSSFVAFASGHEPTKAAAPARDIDPATKARDVAIANAYRDEGLSIAQCRKRFNCSQKRVQAAFRREAVTTRKDGEGQRMSWAAKGKRPMPPIPGVDTSAAAAQDEAIRTRYLFDEMSVPEVAASFEPNLSHELVRRSLKRQNVHMRSASQAALIRWAKRDRAENSDPPPSPPPVQIAEKPAPAPRLPAERPAKKTDAPSNKSNAPHARAPRSETADIVHRYVEALESVTSLAAVYFNGDAGKVKALLTGQGIAIRSKSESQRIAWDRRDKATRQVRPYAPKPKPLAIPEDAPRVSVALGDGEGPAPEYKLQRKGRGKAGADVIKARTAILLKQRQKLDLTPAEQQRLIDEHFAKGGGIKVAPSAPAFGADPVKSAIGTGVGVRRTRGN